MSEDLRNASLIDLFRAELEEHMAALNNGLVACASGSSSDDTLNALMRAAHSIKGAARIVGLQAAVDLAHAMEDCFVAAQEGKAQLHSDRIDVLLKGVDQLSRIGREGRSDPQSQREVNELIAALCRPQAGSSPAHGAGRTQSLQATAVVPAKDPAEISLMDLFRGETRLHSEALLTGLADLEQGSASPKLMEDLRRAAHSIKGAARIVGLNAVVEIADAMEQLFDEAIEGAGAVHASQASILRRGVDLLQQLAEDGTALTSQQIADYRSALKSSKGASSKAAEPGSVTDAAVSFPISTRGEDARAVEAVTGRAPVSATPDRAVRVNATSLNRLMGLAGEYRVETRWLETFAKSLRSLKENQLQLGDLFERLHDMDHTSEALRSQLLFEAQQQRAKCEQLANACIADFEVFAYRSDNLAHRLYGEVLASRMRPFADGVQGFPRMVHDLAKKLGKNVRFEILGKTAEVDRDILDKLEAPLNHLLRNALDHGIETPEERAAAGKPGQAMLTLEASHKGGMLLIAVGDDGRGIDLDRIRQTIIARMLAPPEMVLKMREAELLDFLFLPGFSTSGTVTEISGRGVGLDVVQTILQETGGQARVATTLGKGTHFHLQLPITLSILRVLLVDIGGEPYSFPLARIERVLSIPPEEVRSLENRQFITFDGQHIGLVPAHQVLDVPQSGPADSSHFSVVVVAGRTGRYGLAVDRLIGERDVVVQPLDSRLGKIENVSAAALMEDGTPLLILDVEDVIHSIDSILTGGRLRKVKLSEAVETKQRKRILVVDDSLTVREVVRKLLQNKGYDVEVAADGMDGWHAVRSGRYDLVISDVDMPRMNGIEFVTQIKRDARLKNIPVMIISYKDREGDRLRGLEAGANYYLAKSSFQDETLINAVLDLIGAPN